MVDLLTALPKDALAYGLIIAVVGIMGQIFLQYVKNKGAHDTAFLSAAHSMAQHNTSISIEIMQRLRDELDKANAEISRISPAIDRARMLAWHLDRVLTADDAHRARTEAAAEAYLASIRGVL